MSTWQSGDIDVNGLKIHYTRTGGTKPPLVLVHGFTDDGLCWTPVAEALASDYDVSMPDARGHGFSEAPESGYGPAHHAVDLKGVISALGLQKPIVLGHSMGAITTLALAGIYPDMPGAIILEDPPPWWVANAVPQENAPDRLAKVRESFVQRKNQTREALIDEQRRATPSWSEAELGPWADSKLRLNPNIAQFLEPTIPTSVDWPVLLGKIFCPALLLTADTTLGAIVPPKAATALKHIIPQLRVAHIADAGHSIHREQMSRYMDAVRTFLTAL